MTSLRVMTYNVKRRPGNGSSVPEAALRVIAAAAPDVVALQECGEELLATLAKGLGMRAYSAPGGGRNAFLSYYPMRGIESLVLGASGRCLRADLDIGQKRIHLCNVRLDRQSSYREQITVLLGEDLLGSRRASLPTLVMGDFDYYFGWMDWTLRETLNRAVQTVFHGTFPSSFPLLARDRAYVCGGLRILSAHVVRGRSARHAATHLPLLVTVRIIDPRHYLKTEETLTVSGMETAPG